MGRTAGSCSGRPPPERTIQDAPEVRGAAWTLAMDRLTDEPFQFPLTTDASLQSAPVSYIPLLERQQTEYRDQLVQPTLESIRVSNEYDSTHLRTGAAWDVRGTDTSRWESLGTTLGGASAKEFPRGETPARIESGIVATLEDNDAQPANSRAGPATCGTSPPQSGSWNDGERRSSGTASS